MKVLHLGKYFPPHFGGIETFMSQLMEEQSAQGLEVSAIVHADILQSEHGVYEWKGCEIIEVKSYGQVVFAPIAPAFPFRLYKALRAIQPDILHIHMPNLSAFWMLFFNLICAKDTKIVIHWHADVLGSAPTKMVRLLYPVYRIFESWLLKISDRLIATSPPYLQTSEPLSRYKEKSNVIPLGIKVAQNTVNLQANATQLKLLMIGRLTYYKNHRMVLDAVKELLNEGISVSLDIVGDGELKPLLLQLAKSLEIGDSVTFYGKVSEYKKAELLAHTDLLLLPSTERTEAFGVVLLEAASFSKPALVTDVPGSGMSYVIEDGYNGIVCKANSIDVLVDKLKFLSRNKPILESMGENAFKKLKAEFDLSVITKNTTALYEGRAQ